MVCRCLHNKKPHSEIQLTDTSRQLPVTTGCLPLCPSQSSVPTIRFRWQEPSALLEGHLLISESKSQKPKFCVRNWPLYIFRSTPLDQQGLHRETSSSAEPPLISSRERAEAALLHQAGEEKHLSDQKHTLHQGHSWARMSGISNSKISRQRSKKHCGLCKKQAGDADTSP